MTEIRNTDPQNSFRGKHLLYTWGKKKKSQHICLHVCFLTAHLLYFAYIHSQDLI